MKKTQLTVVVVAVIALGALGAGLTSVGEHVSNSGAITKTETNTVTAGYGVLTLQNQGTLSLDKSVVASGGGMVREELVNMQGPVNVQQDGVVWNSATVDKYRDIRTGDLREVEVLNATGTGSEQLNVSSNNYINSYGQTVWRPLTTTTTPPPTTTRPPTTTPPPCTVGCGGPPTTTPRPTTTRPPTTTPPPTTTRPPTTTPPPCTTGCGNPPPCTTGCGEQDEDGKYVYFIEVTWNCDSTHIYRASAGTLGGPKKLPSEVTLNFPGGYHAKVHSKNDKNRPLYLGMQVPILDSHNRQVGFGTVTGLEFKP